MATGKVNTGGGGGGGLNIFTQLAEPRTKDGIWLQTQDKFKTIFLEKNVYLANSWVLDALPELPKPRLNPVIVYVNDKIYVFGGSQTSGEQDYHTDVLKFNLVDNTLSYVTDMPTAPSKTRPWLYNPIVKDDYIYFFGATSTSTTRNITRFNHVTETWDGFQSTYPPRGVSSGGYLFEYDEEHLLVVGGNTGTLYTQIYNINTNTWTELGSYSVTNTNVYSNTVYTKVGNLVYLLGTQSGSLNIMVIDLSTNTLARLDSTPGVPAKVPFVLKGGVDFSLLLGDEVHIFGSPYLANQLSYVIFNTTTKTWSYGPPMLRLRNDTNVVFDPIRRKVYIIGGRHDTTNAISKSTDMLSFISKQYTNDELVLLVQDTYDVSRNQKAVKLFPTTISIKNGRFMNFFNDAWIFKNGDLREYPAYYGDGTQWIKFKN